MLSVALLALVFVFRSTSAPEKARSGPSPAAPVPLTLTTAPAVVRDDLANAEKLLQRKSWKKAIHLLQGILDARETFLVPAGNQAKKRGAGVSWTSARLEVNRLLGTMAAPGRKIYEAEYGPRANELMQKATLKNPQLLAAIARRYEHTVAGRRALTILAAHFLAIGRPARAADFFARLLAQPDATPEAATLYQAARAFRLAGVSEDGKRTWERLRARIGDKGLRVGSRILTRKQAEEELAKAAPRKWNEPATLSDWRMTGGNPSRSARAKGSRPAPFPVWQTSTIRDELNDPKAMNPDTESWVEMALDAQKKLKLPVLPGFFPIAANGKLIYRTYGAIQGMYIDKGEDLGGKHEAGELAWQMVSDGSLTSVLNDASNQWLVAQWKTQYKSSLHHIIFSNSMVGSLTTDGDKVYAVDDLALLPHPEWLLRFMRNGGHPEYPGFLPKLVSQNTLRALDLESGKVLWELPDRFKPGNLADTHFLGAPLAVAGKLYALNEKKGEVRLLCLQSGHIDPQRLRFGVRVIRSQALCRVPDPITNDLGRRMHTVNLAYADDMLVCPTGAGLILGFDLITKDLAWNYWYREVPPTPGLVRPRIAPKAAAQGRGWVTSAAIISDGQVVFAPWDSDFLHCLDLGNGALRWKVRREGDLYLAGVYDGKVILVGPKGCRARGLKDGKPLWALEIGMPSGQGSAAGDVYYLPLASGEIAAIDIEKGRLRGRIRSRKRGLAFGNLIFADGYLFSQSATSVAAYPPLAAKVREINRRLAKNPADAEALVERGAYSLADGKIRDAIVDLRKALAGQPPPPVAAKARLLLYEALDEFFERDFRRAAARYLKDYKGLCRVTDPAETARRRFRFVALVGRAYEQEGKLREALRLYLANIDLAADGKLMVSPDDAHLKVRPAAWFRGRITTLLNKADAKQRKAMDEEINKKWREIRGREKNK
jgi:outer membrane protein assembly factor BamB